MSEEQFAFPNAAQELEQMLVNEYRHEAEFATCSMEARGEVDRLFSNAEHRQEIVNIIDDFLEHFAAMVAHDIVTECSKGDYTAQQLLDIIDDAFEVGNVMRSLDEEDDNDEE